MAEETAQTDGELELKVKEGFVNIGGKDIRFYEGIDKHAEYTFSNHLRADSWDLVVFAYFHEAGMLPEYEGPSFKEASRNHEFIINSTVCWVEDYEERVFHKPKEQSTDAVSSDRLRGRSIMAMASDLSNIAEGGKSSVGEEQFDMLLGKLERKQKQATFKIGETTIPLYHSISQHLDTQKRVRKEAEGIRKIAYNEVTLAFLNIIGANPEYDGYEFSKTVDQLNWIRLATHYIIEAPIESQLDYESMEKLAEIQRGIKEENEMIEVMKEQAMNVIRSGRAPAPK